MLVQYYANMNEYDLDYTPPEEFRPEKLRYKNIITQYNPIYCNLIIEHAQNGGSVESFPGKESIDPDAITDWCDEYPEFKAAVKIAMSAECYFYEQYIRFACNRLNTYKDILPTLNRKMAMIESTLSKNGLRKSVFNYEEPDQLSKDKLADREAIAAMEEF